MVENTATSRSAVRRPTAPPTGNAYSPHKRRKAGSVAQNERTPLSCRTRSRPRRPGAGGRPVAPTTSRDQAPRPSPIALAKGFSSGARGTPARRPRPAPAARRRAARRPRRRPDGSRPRPRVRAHWTRRRAARRGRQQQGPAHQAIPCTSCRRLPVEDLAQDRRAPRRRGRRPVLLFRPCEQRDHMLMVLLIASIPHEDRPRPIFFALHDATIARMPEPDRAARNPVTHNLPKSSTRINRPRPVRLTLPSLRG